MSELNPGNPEPYNTPPPQRFQATPLPLLQKLTSAYKLWHSFLSHIPRLTRYSLGEKVNQLFIELIELTLAATYSGREQKAAVVERASLKLDLLKYFVQIAWELKALDNQKFGALSQPLGEAGKMLGGWSKQLQKETPPRAGGA